MSLDTAVKLFEGREVRSAWDENKEEWFFSIVDVVSVLTESVNPPAYWRKLKQRLIEEGNETVTDCHGLKMKATDGKMRMTDVANTEQLLRIIQSIPSKKAEPFKMWLAKVGSERIDEISDPELSIERAVNVYRAKGYSEKWISQRLKSVEVRKELTDEWVKSGVSGGRDFAILTNEITKAWSGKSVSEYKAFKSLKKESLRDNMTNMELVLNMLAEVTTTDISRAESPKGFEQSRSVARRGGKVAKNARIEVEKQTGHSVLSRKNAESMDELDDGDDE